MHSFIYSIVLISISVTLIVIYNYSYGKLVRASANYKLDTCILKDVFVQTVTIDCVSDGVSVVDIPCLYALVDTTTLTNIRLYRSCEEKLWILRNDANCSYLTYDCKADTSFHNRLLSNKYLQSFPPIMAKFNCYTSSHDSKQTKIETDALLAIPDSNAFYISIAILLFGLAIGLLLLAFSLRKYIDSMISKEIIEHNVKAVIDTMDKVCDPMAYDNEDEDLNESDRLQSKLIEIENQANLNNLTMCENILRNKALLSHRKKTLFDLGFRIYRVGYPSFHSSFSSISKSMKDELTSIKSAKF